MKLTPVAYGCKLEMINLLIDAVDTQRPKPEVGSSFGDYINTACIFIVLLRLLDTCRRNSETLII